MAMEQAEKIYIYSDQGPLSHFPIQIQGKIQSAVRENEESKLLKGVGPVPVSAFIISDQRNQESKLLARSPVSDFNGSHSFQCLSCIQAISHILFPHADRLST